VNPDGDTEVARPFHRSVIKGMLFRPLAVLPVSLSARLIPPALHEPFTRYLVQSGERGRGGAFLAATTLRGSATPATPRIAVSSKPGGRVVLLGGPARVGKSLAAGRLAGRLGFRVLNSDHLHGWYGILGGHEEVREFREGWVTHLLEHPGGGVVVEGALLVMEGRHDTRDARVSLAAFERWCRNHAVVGFTVGSAAADRIDRLRAVERQLATCWTAGHSRRQRWNIVRHVAHLSASLRDEAARRDVPYREISPDTFEDDIAALVAQAESAVRRAGGRESAASGPNGPVLHRVPAANAPGQEREQGESEPRQEGAKSRVANPD
jgi:hypothetical protein